MMLASSPISPAYRSDAVFDALGAALLRGEIAPGSDLPTEGTLSTQLGVSKVLVRQAIHRLAAMGLVHVRQGGATRALDPSTVSTLGVLELYYRLAPEKTASADLRREVLEKQFTQGMSLVDVFARHASTDEKEALVALAKAANPRALAAFEEQFWHAVAQGGGNRILIAEVRWWYALASRPSPPHAHKTPAAETIAFYVELARRLQSDRKPVSFYRDTLGPTLETRKPR